MKVFSKRFRAGWACFTLLALVTGGVYVLADGTNESQTVLTQSNPQIPVPCSATTGKGLKACTALLVENGGEMDLVPTLKRRLRVQVGQYFNHIDADAIDPPGHFFGPTVCNLVPSNALGINANGVSGCGNPMLIKSSVDKKAKKLTLGFNKKLPNGTLEDGILRGGLVAATSCFYQDVVSELRSSNKMTIKGELSACRAFASDYRALYDRYLTLVTRIAALPGGAGDISKLPTCEKTLGTCTPTSTACTDPNGRPIVPPTQGYAQLCAARQALEGSFTHLAACEIFSRARVSYEHNTGSAESQLAILDEIRKTLSESCRDECKQKLSKDSQKKIESVGKCFNSCYPKALIKNMTSKMEKLWPPSGGSCAWVGGFLGFVPFRLRRRRRKFSRSRAFTLATLPALALVLTGCPKSILDLNLETQLIVDSPACPAQIGGQNAACCDGSGTPIVSSENKSCQKSPGSAAVKTALLNGSQINQTATAALDATEEYIDSVDGSCRRLAFGCPLAPAGCTYDTSAVPKDSLGCPTNCGKLTCGNKVCPSVDALKCEPVHVGCTRGAPLTNSNGCPTTCGPTTCRQPEGCEAAPACDANPGCRFVGSAPKDNKGCQTGCPAQNCLPPSDVCANEALAACPARCTNQAAGAACATSGLRCAASELGNGFVCSGGTWKAVPAANPNRACKKICLFQ